MITSFDIHRADTAAELDTLAIEAAADFELTATSLDDLAMVAAKELNAYLLRLSGEMIALRNYLAAELTNAK